MRLGATLPSPEETMSKVAVVGAGPVGLCCALLLARFGVETTVFERNAGTSVHPRGHVVNARSLEILRSLGLEQSVRAESLPASRNQGVSFLRRLSEPDIAVLRTQGIPERDEPQREASPCLRASCPQDRLEPILLAAARSEPLVQLDFSSDVQTVEQDGEGVRITGTGPQGAFDRAFDYAVGADGARSTVRNQIGIAMKGRGRIGRQIGIYFEADLWPLIQDRPYLLWWIYNAQTCGVLIALDGRRRWTYNFAFDERETAADFTPERCQAILRAVLGTDVPVEIRSIVPWRMQALLAERMGDRRVFLAGDAAHPLPPTGGQGMNTGIADVHNLAWKMALVLTGRAASSLLETYDAERRPVASFNIEQSVANALKMAEFGLSGMATPDSDMARSLDGPDRVAAEARLREAVPHLREHFDYLGQTFGQSYGRGALLPDGTAEPLEAFSVHTYRPSARPGSRAPHIWLDQGGRAVSTIDLIGFDGFTLFATPEQAGWSEAFGEAIQTRHLAGRSWVVGPGCGLDDPSGRFRKLYGLEGGGAVLVRPDGHVAARWFAPSPDPAADLAPAFDAILGGAAVAAASRSAA
jgi:putative polyketide hydroxylase